MQCCPSGEMKFMPRGGAATSLYGGVEEERSPEGGSDDECERLEAQDAP